MSTLTSMRKLSRLPKGQISVSSDRQIVDEIREATIRISKSTKVCGEDVDFQHLVNAWAWGLTRLPEPERLAISQVLAKDLERWLLEQPQLSGEELLAGLREAITPPQPPAPASPVTIGGHTVGRPSQRGRNKRHAGAETRADRKKPRAEAHC